MSLRLSSPLESKLKNRIGFEVKSVDLHRSGESTSPIIMLDDFKINGISFPPHPHAGFSVVTYLFQDSEGGLRSRDSLGNDVRVGPGGIVLTQAGEGLIHQEMQDQVGREIHGVQVYINNSAKNKLTKPEVLWKEKKDIPQWLNDQGDLVQVVVGHYQEVTSSLQPVEPFTLLDAKVHSRIEWMVREGHVSLIYIQAGNAWIITDEKSLLIKAGQAMTISGNGRLKIQAEPAVQALILDGIALNEPIVTHGPFIMNDRSQIQSAIARFESGAMGYLSPV